MNSLVRSVVGPLSIAAVLFLCGRLPAGTQVLEAKLDGKHEVPSNNSTATGEATITLNDATGDVTVNGTYQGLGSEARLAHIHGLAASGANAAPIVSLTISGGTSGTVSGSGTLTAAQIQGMLEGLTYVNIHTANLGGGEIRGQVVRPAPVPVLPSWGLVALAVLLGVGAVGLLLRRRALA